MRHIEPFSNRPWEFMRRFACLTALVAFSGTATATDWDVYLLGGQSNAVGWNTNRNVLPAALQAPQPDVMLFHGVGGSWSDLAPGSGNNANAFGPEVTFGRTLADDNPTRNIAIVKYAVSGTGLVDDWNPDDPGVNDYDRFLATLDDAIAALPAGDTYSVAGMLWMQGERDTNFAAATAAYDANLANFISKVRTDVGAPDMPFVIGQLAFAVVSAARTDNWPVVQNAQAHNAALDDDAYLVVTTDLPLQADALHLTSSAQHDFGIRCAKAVQGQLAQLQITNRSFETPQRTDNGTNSAIVSGWIKSGGSIGTYNPGGSFYTDPSVLDANGGMLGDMDGVHALYMIGTNASVEQTLSAAVEPGMYYSVAAAIGDRDTGGDPDFAGARLELLAGGQVLADSGDITILADGTFTPVSISYWAKVGDAGALGIRLIALDGASGHSVDFDNVRITAMPPSHCGLLGAEALPLFAAALWWRRRRPPGSH